MLTMKYRSSYPGFSSCPTWCFRQQFSSSFRFRTKCEGWRQSFIASSTPVLLLLLPLLLLLQALDCVDVAGEVYVRVDTSVSCTGSDYGTFVALDAALIAVYLAIPVA